VVVRKADVDIADLWAAVLEEAISDALGSRLNLRESAWAWFRSENQGIGSFLWICTMLDLNPKFVRVEV